MSSFTSSTKNQFVRFQLFASLYGTKLNAYYPQNRLSPLQTIDCTDESTLCLSLDWSTRRSATPESVLQRPLS